MTSVLVKSVETLLAEKQALAEQERRLIGTLNRVLTEIGYEVVAMSAPNNQRGGRPAGRRAKTLLCPQCSRRFAHPLHLGRHVSATHRKKKAA